MAFSDATDYLAAVKRKVKDTAGRYVDSEKDAFVQEAVEQYARDKPRRVDDLITGDGTALRFATPSAWEDRFSVILEIEFPTGEDPVVLIENLQDTFRIVQQSNVELIQFLTLTIPNLDTLRILFTAPHIVDGSSNTIPTNDENAVVALAASKLAAGLAAFYAEAHESSIDAETVDNQTKADTFSDLSEKLIKEYREHITAGEIESPILILHDQDVEFSWQRDLITHPRRNR